MSYFARKDELETQAKHDEAEQNTKEENLLKGLEVELEAKSTPCQLKRDMRPKKTRLELGGIVGGVPQHFRQVSSIEIPTSL